MNYDCNLKRIEYLCTWKDVYDEVSPSYGVKRVLGNRTCGGSISHFWSSVHDFIAHWLGG